MTGKGQAHNDLIEKAIEEAKVSKKTVVSLASIKIFALRDFIHLY